MRFIRKIYTLPIRLYQILLSPYLTVSCRFQPTCSAYAYKAIVKHGIFQGTWLTAKRLLSCHPWGRSGYDPVP